MPIPVQCAVCLVNLKAPDRMLGSKTRCPKCKAYVYVTHPEPPPVPDPPPAPRPPDPPPVLVVTAPQPIARLRPALPAGTYYLGLGAEVTSDWVKLAGVSYAVRNVTSVRVTSIPPKRDNVLVAAVIGIGCLVGGPAMLFDRSLHAPAQAAAAAAILVMIGLALIVLAAWLFQRAKTLWCLLLRTSSGEARGLTSWDAGEIGDVADAIERAVADYQR